mgnify:CR=1 FL=1
MVVTRREVLASVPVALSLSGCSQVVGDDGSNGRPPYVVANESDATRDVTLRVWEVGPVDPLEERPDSFREDFETGVADGSVVESDYRSVAGYEVTVEPGSTARPLDSTSASGLLYLHGRADHRETIGVWLEVAGPDEPFFPDVSVYGNGMSVTTGEY